MTLNKWLIYKNDNPQLVSSPAADCVLYCRNSQRLFLKAIPLNVVERSAVKLLSKGATECAY